MYCYLSVGPEYEKYVFIVLGDRVSKVLFGNVTVSLQKLTMGTWWKSSIKFNVGSCKSP